MDIAGRCRIGGPDTHPNAKFATRVVGDPALSYAWRRCTGGLSDGELVTITLLGCPSHSKILLHPNAATSLTELGRLHRYCAYTRRASAAHCHRIRARCPSDDRRVLQSPEDSILLRLANPYGGPRSAGSAMRPARRPSSRLAATPDVSADAGRGAAGGRLTRWISRPTGLDITRHEDRMRADVALRLLHVSTEAHAPRQKIRPGWASRGSPPGAVRGTNWRPAVTPEAEMTDIVTAPRAPATGDQGWDRPPEAGAQVRILPGAPS